VTRPIRRGRLDALDRVRPGLADSARRLLGPARELAGHVRTVRPRSAPGARRRSGPGFGTRGAGTGTGVAELAAVTALVRGPLDPAGARAALDAVLALRSRAPGPALDRLLVVAGGRVRSRPGGPPVDLGADGRGPTTPGLEGVPADEAALLVARLTAAAAAAAASGSEMPGVRTVPDGAAC